MSISQVDGLSTDPGDLGRHSSLSTWGKVPKLGVSDPRSRAQVQLKGQALSSSTVVSEVAGV